MKMNRFDKRMRNLARRGKYNSPFAIKETQLIVKALRKLSKGYKIHAVEMYVK
jgi:hypothetical protein